MTRSMTKPSRPVALVGGTVGSTLISIAAVWLVTSFAFAPVVAKPDAPSVEHSKSFKPAGPLFRLSPIPPGADWTA